jgi:hypothetical protein
MPSNGYPFEYGEGIGARGAIRDTAFILITPGGKGGDGEFTALKVEKEIFSPMLPISRRALRYLKVHSRHSLSF